MSLRAAAPLAGSSRHSLGGVDVVRIGRGDPACQRETIHGRPALVLQLPDARLSREHAELRRHGLDQFELVDRDSKNHSFVGGIARTNHMLADGDCLELGSTFFTFRRLREAGSGERDVYADGADANDALTTLKPDLARQLATFSRAAASRVSLVINGETGTGKELAARAAHALSGRAGAFVAVNCGALPATLLEAELFGYRKGAFSGAIDDRVGLVRASDRGTLFLDEVGELPPPAQTALLRVLQENEVLPIGHVRPLPVDLRIVSATNRNLRQLVERGEFRADLHARLQGVTVTLPPLRERREELGLLVSRILRRLAGDRAQTIRLSTTAARQLLEDRWPQNIRALEKCLAAALVLCEGDLIDAHDLASSGVLVEPQDSREEDDPAVDSEEDVGGVALSPRDEEQRARLVELVRKHGGNISAVAREMNKARFQVRRWIKRYRIR